MAASCGRSTQALDGMRTLGISVRVAAAIAVAISATGCAESSFVLARESRLPAWFETPPGQARENLSVTMDYYVLPSRREAKFTLSDSRGRQITSKTGEVRSLAPTTFGNAHYPSYEVIEVEGVVDVVEHRKMEPVFYVTDDPAVWKQLGVFTLRSGK